MKSLLIVNPQSGGGTTREVFQQQKERLERELGAFDVAWTERSNHATEIAEREAKAGRGTIIGVGGDGTFNEIVAGVMRSDASARLGAVVFVRPTWRPSASQVGEIASQFLGAQL